MRIVAKDYARCESYVALTIEDAINTDIASLLQFTN